MNKQRLLKLADVLMCISPNKFNISSWRQSPGGWYRRQEETTDEKLMDVECGTAACAVGWACAVPQFMKAGLGFDVSGGEPTFDTRRGWAAVHTFFQISSIEAHLLFSEDRYDVQEVAPKHVAIRILRLVDGESVEAIRK